ncbi:uncharacterized protein LOC132564841, partial [Ylistrum balloti]|uniref:uncharacterized protein LOC132564841 n=1 Tax=Ylistrum balloti TaxID=509963 RepID=UPI002905824E
LTDGLKYKSENDGNGLYKVNEIRQNQSSGSNICKQQYSELIKITSPSQMLFLQGVISSNTILSLDYRFFVSGQYVTKWRYDDGAEIADSSLWSVGQPEPSDGSCVMMTSTGLSSVDCSQLLFFICHH